MEHTAVNQAFRTEWVLDRWFGQRVPEMMWAMQTDNAASAANIPGALGVQGIRCFDHMINLTPRHLLFPVKRQHNKVERWERHELAVPEVLDLCEKARAEVKRIKHHEHTQRAFVKYVSVRPNMKNQLSTCSPESAFFGKAFG